MLVIFFQIILTHIFNLGTSLTNSFKGKSHDETKYILFFRHTYILSQVSSRLYSRCLPHDEILDAFSPLDLVVYSFLMIIFLRSRIGVGGRQVISTLSVENKSVMSAKFCGFTLVRNNRK